MDYTEDCFVPIVPVPALGCHHWQRSLGCFIFEVVSTN
jgi:hypothetical protein